MSAVKTGLHYEVYESADSPGDWVVAAVDGSSEGEVYIALFSGPAAEERAREYALWKSP